MMNTKQELAFVFPGQGSQKVGMLADLAEQSPLLLETFAEASATLGYDLWALVQNGPQEQLNLTEITQPALLTSSVALWRLWQASGGALPAMMAGHSLGEWSALVCAGVVKFSDAVELVRARGKYMQEAVPAGIGAMAAIIGLDDDIVEQACVASSDEHVLATAVNYNSPGQLVIAGHGPAVEAAMAKCKELGAKRALPLPVSAPFHTLLMQPAAERLSAAIEATAFQSPVVPVVHNVTAKPEHDPVKIKALMIEQIYSPVRWVSCVQTMAAMGMAATLECGPGKVLSGLNKRINKNLNTYNIDTAAALDVSIAALK